MAALVGGWNGKAELASAKLLVFDDSRKGMRWVPLPDLPAPVVNPAACSDGAGRLIVAGGKRAGQPLREVVAWTESAGWHALPQLRVSRDGPRAVSLMDGRAMVIGGSRGPADLASCEYLDPERGVWVGAPSMLTARRSFGCAVMPDGRVRPMHLPARLPHAATRRDAMRCDTMQGSGAYRSTPSACPFWGVGAVPLRPAPWSRLTTSRVVCRTVFGCWGGSAAGRRRGRLRRWWPAPPQRTGCRGAGGAQLR
jgi:hypothetical protein